MNDSEQVWVYATGGERRGPSSAREIGALISGDRLPEQTLVWKPGMSDWAPARDVPEISRYCAPPVPRSLVGNNRETARPIAQGAGGGGDNRPGRPAGAAGVLAGDPAPAEKAKDTSAPSRPSVVVPTAPVTPSQPHRPPAAAKWGESLKVLGFILVVSVAGALGRGIGRAVVPPSASTERPTSVAFLTRVAEQMSRQIRVPKMLDSETQLVRVEALEGMLVYQNRFVNYSRDQMDPPALEAAQRRTLQASICSTPETRDNLLKRGIMMRYAYRDRFDALVMTIDIRPADCGL